MADPGARAGAQGSAPVATGSSITFLIEAGGSEALPRSKAIVLIDPVAPQSLGLTIPNLHYGSRGPILGVLDFAQRVTGSAESANTPEPLASRIAQAAATETPPVALDLATNAPGFLDAGSLVSLVLSDLPVGAILSDGTHSFLATDGNTTTEIQGWNLSALTIAVNQATSFSLTLIATEPPTSPAAAQPLAPTLAPVAATGLEGSPIALDLGTSVNGLAGDTNSLASLVVSAIPVGATLSDGTHSFTATAGNTAVDVHGWTLSSLTVTSTNDANFTLSIAATARDAEGNLSAVTTATETVTVNPLTPTLAPVAETGLEGSPIALNLGASVNGLAGDANSLASLTISAIPVGATLSDGTHTFTATAGNTSVDVHGWNLSSLTVTSTNDANFTLSIAATARDAEGNLSAVPTATETVTVNPLTPTLAPVAETGLEGSPIALDLGASVNGLAGDANSLASLTISAIPVGATLSDGTHSFTASAGNTAVNVSGWNLSSLTVTSTNDANFPLSIAATARQAEGNLSAVTTATEPVTVNPLTPTLAPVAETGLEGSPIALDLGASVNGLVGDTNSFASLVVGAIPVGATLSDGTHSFTASAGSTSVDVHGWTLSSLTVTSTNDANFTLSIAATARDAEGNLSAVTTATETVTVNPLAPTLAPVAETGLEGSPIALNLGTSVNGLAGDANSLASL